MKDYEEIVNGWLKERGFNSIDEFKEHQLKEQEKWQKSFNNEYLKTCDLNNIDIWELQKSLKDKDLIEIDFKDNAIIMVTKNEIYLKVWGPTSISVYFLPSWNVDMYGDFDNYDYIQLQKDDDIFNDYWDRIAKRLVEKCNYTMKGHYTKEGVLKDIEKYLNK